MAAEPVLTIRAGPRALAKIRAEGLDAAMVEIVPGAAGGPKGLGIAGLDRAIFGEWLPAAPRVRHLIGASIGAWRFAAACRDDPARALDHFARAYTLQSYPPRPSKRFVSQAARAMLAELFAGHEAEILSHPWHRLHIVDRARALAAHARFLLRDAARLRHGRHGQHPRAAVPRALHRPHRVPRCARAPALHDGGRARRARCGHRALRRVPHAQGRARRLEPHRGVAGLGLHPAGARRRGRHSARPARHLLGWRHHRLPPAPALSPRRRAGALSALHRLHRPRLARQGVSVAARARRLAGQRGAGRPVGRVSRRASPRQAARSPRFRALRGQ